MPRNPSGTYTLPEAAFVPGTVISSTAVNSDFSDIANALTDSLSRSGDGGMQAQLPMDATGFAYTNDPDTGMVRTGTNAQALKCGGSNIVTVTTSGADVTGSLTLNGSAILPVGGVIPYAGSSAPTNWLLCYGQSLVRTDYAALFAAIGTTYGAADSTHFSIPDLRGRIPPGKDDMGGSAAGRLTTAGSGVDGATLGASGGAQNVTLTQAELPAVSPAFSGNEMTSTSTVANVITASVAANSFGFGTGGSIFAALSQNTANINTILSKGTPTGTISPLGSGEAHNNVQPSLVLNYIIYAGA